MVHNKKYLRPGAKIFSFSINFQTVESKIATDLGKVQRNIKFVEIGSYPFFRLGKIGVSVVIRSKKGYLQSCHKDIIRIAKNKKIKMSKETNVIFAFGSNLHKKQMKKRCKDSKYIGCYTLKNYKLSFRTGSYSRGIMKWELLI